MDIQTRLKRLEEQVKEQRAQGHIKNWPQEIKREAIFLAQEAGFWTTSKITKLHFLSLQKWRDEFSKEKPCRSGVLKKINEPKITRIILQSSKIDCETNKIPLVIATKNEIEFKIYCKEMAEKLAERIFK